MRFSFRQKILWKKWRKDYRSIEKKCGTNKKIEIGEKMENKYFDAIGLSYGGCR